MPDEFPMDPGGSGWAAMIIGFVVSLFNSLLNLLFSLANWVERLMNVLGRFLLDLARAVAEGATIIAWMFARFLDVLRQLWVAVLQPAIRKLWDMILAVQRVLQRIFAPVLRVLTQIRAFLQRLYDGILRPILDIIDLFRIALRGLAALGIDWARELDARLARLQQLLSAPLLDAIKKVNEIASWIDRIVTLDGLFQRLIWLRTLGAYRLPTIRLWWNSHSTPLSAGEVAALRLRNKPRTTEETRAALVEYARRQAGPLAPRINEHVLNMRLRLAKL